jgi:surface protein
VNVGSNYNVDWGDGTSQTGVTATITTKTYATAGIYDIKITGVCPQQVNGLSANDKLKYLKIKQWGSGVTTISYFGAFRGCSNLTVTATDAPSMTGVATLASMFRGCSSIGSPDFSGWDVSGISTFSTVFSQSNFNGNITTWNTASATNMVGMFQSNSSFNQNIGSWNVGNVTTFSTMFQGASAFNQNLSSWNVGKVTNFSQMFDGATDMLSNTSIASWDIGSQLTGSTTITFVSMFANVNHNVDLTSWNMIRADSIASMFFSGRNDNNYGLWNIINVNSANNFQFQANTSTISATTLANMYVGWASQALRATLISFGTAKYDASGASARAILTAPRAVSVTGAGDPLADGTYTHNATRYENPNGYYFGSVLVVTQTQWRVFSPSNVELARSNSSFPSQNNVNPATSSGWSGAWAGMVVTMTGAGWTITDGGQL